MSNYNNKGEKDRLLPKENEPRKGRVFGARPDESEKTSHIESDQLLYQQQATMRDQDAAVDLIAQSVARTKQIAIAIGTEADTQSALIDEVSAHTDKTSARVKNAGNAVDRVHTKASTKAAWAVIIILIISLIVVSVLAVYF